MKLRTEKKIQIKLKIKFQMFNVKNSSKYQGYSKVVLGPVP
jgi:hypothetical protein